MKKIKYILFFCVLINFITIKVDASYRIPFPDNEDLVFVQTWHAWGLHYVHSGSSYSWESGPNYAIDINRADGLSTDIISPDDGTVMYRQDCSYSTNLILEFSGYEFQFYHLNNSGIDVIAGDSVSKGEVLGTLYSGPFSDSCGHSDGTHLHLKFETQQGNEDSQRVVMSGFTFDEYDGHEGSGGDSGCIMHRVENGQVITYCYPGYGGTINFTANDPNGSSGNSNNCSGFSIFIISGNKTDYICGVNNGGTILVTPGSNLSPESKLYTL